MDARQRVLGAVRTCDGTTRAELAEELGLPLGTVTTAVTGLLRAGALAERPAASAAGARAGRPAMLLVPTAPPRTVGAVIWAHGRLQIAVATYGGTVLARSDLSVPDDPSDPQVLDPAWMFLSEAGGGALDRIMLGVPAPFQRGVGLPPARLPVPDPVDGGTGAPRSGFAPWLRPDPASALAERLGVPVVIENDANLGALGEAHAGAGRGHRCQVYLKLGERSVGAGLVLDGALYRGTSGFAGEIAHIHADDEGPLCICGARGCLSARARRPLVELMETAYDRPLDFAEVLRLADADEPAPARVLREVGRALGRPLADLCTFLDPGLLVLDGALGGAGRHVLRGLSEQIERYCAPAVASSLTLVVGALGTDADLSGAIRLARAEALAPAGR
ncbi:MULTISPECIES: ROK family transcriptional regulator [Streptacidiphilus]|uniref:ROK family transcriptional regulator n=1 Tax=Streptacidiphilus cavernicola TaxID=3342716 RepID=A0ABV6UYM4_9ACTN|nr:ROK family transcriptional regulator [Streptacidiphilus jeojiense]